MPGWGHAILPHLDYPLQWAAVNGHLQSTSEGSSTWHPRRNLGWGWLSISCSLKACRRYAISGSATMLSKLPDDMLGGIDKGLFLDIKASELTLVPGGICSLVCKPKAHYGNY